MENIKDQQTIDFLALLLCRRGEPCTPEELCNDCTVFEANPEELRKSCVLEIGPLRLCNNGLVYITQDFISLLNKNFFRAFINQNKSKHVGPPPPLMTAADLEKLRTPQIEVDHDEPKLRTSIEGKMAVHEGVDTTQGIGASTKKLTPKQVDPPRTPQIEVDHEEPKLRTSIEGKMAVHEGVDTTQGIRASTKKLTPKQVECTLDSSPMEKEAEFQGEGIQHLDEILSKPLERPERLATDPLAAAVCGSSPPALAAELNLQSKQKSRDCKVVPRFEEYAVEGEVGSGGYGTVYKVLRKSDDKVLAIKCPLEKTHRSCVQNEINMLKRLRGKDFIIQFEGQINAKLKAKPEAAENEINCILLEFIEHDRPEVLKKEITIEEIKCYCTCLFKALAQLHKEKILHLDVKPGNFLFSRSKKRGCLVDFNLARDESIKQQHKRPNRFLDPRVLENKMLPARGISCKRSMQEDRAAPPAKRSRKSTEPAARTVVAPSSNRGVQNLQQLSQLPTDAKGAITTPVRPVETTEIKDCHNGSGNVDRTNAANPQEPVDHMAKLSMRGKNPLLRKYLEKMKQSPGSSPQAPNRKRIQASDTQASQKAKGKLGVAQLPRPSTQLLNGTRHKGILRQRRPVRDGPCVGTKGYRAPEVLLRSPRQTTKVDIWSAGVSLLQLVTGRSPFPSTNSDGALKDIAKLRGSLKLQKLAEGLGQRHPNLKETYAVISVKEWCEKYTKRPDLKGKVPSSLYDLIENCLEVDPASRITAEQALSHEFCLTDSDASQFSILAS